MPSVRLWASTDRVDIDVAVRLVDHDHEGRSILLCDGITRLRFAQSTREQQFVAPGDSAEVTVTLDPVCHTFLPGHCDRADSERLQRTPIRREPMQR